MSATELYELQRDPLADVVAMEMILRHAKGIGLPMPGVAVATNGYTTDFQFQHAESVRDWAAWMEVEVVSEPTPGGYIRHAAEGEALDHPIRICAYVEVTA